YTLGMPAIQREQRLSGESRRQAYRYALLHWRYFDAFVTEESSWLAPDNFQENPAPVVAMRTSPTNIGLHLLSTVSAADLGFLSLEDAAERLERAFRSMERMRRFRGHFYNWYDLRDLHVLEPGYISTVDSGNLAGHLIALRQGCLELADAPVVDGRLFRSLELALDLELLSLAARPDTNPEATDPAMASDPVDPTVTGERATEIVATIKAARAAVADARNGPPGTEVLASLLEPLRAAAAPLPAPPPAAA